MNNFSKFFLYSFIFFLIVSCKKEKTNTPPTADAGLSQTIQLPLNYTLLSGSGGDIDGSIVTYSWVQTSGPTSSKIESPASAATKVSGLIAGVYSFKFTVTDNQAASATDTVSITVIAGQNKVPVANAGIPQVIQLPDNYTYLAGSGKDEDGTISTYKWTQTSGPSVSNIESSGSALTKISSLIAGVYRYQLMVTDNKGDSGVDSVSVTVLPAVNKVPVVNAGINQTIQLPQSYVTLAGSATDSDGIIKGYLWSQLSGPAASVIENPASVTTKVAGLNSGTYIFQLMAVDDKGATGLDTMTVDVKPSVIQTITIQEGTLSDFKNVAVLGFTDVSASGGDINAQAWTSGGVSLNNRGHFKFNLSQIPSGATIVSAKLSLYSVPSGSLTNGDRITANYGYNNSMFIRRIISDWDGNTVTWFTQPTTTTVGQISVPHTSLGFLDLVDMDVTGLVSSMISENKRYGFMMMLQDETYYNTRQFCSPIFSDISKRPKLVVTYQ